MKALRFPINLSGSFVVGMALIGFVSGSHAQIAFTNTGQRLDTTNCAWEIQMADINGDGALDAYLNGAIWLNDGQGRFTKSSQSFGPADRPASFADLNNDGSVDVVCDNVVYLNDGLYGFGQTNTVPSDIPMLKAVLADLNGDGTIDIIVGSQYEDRILLNDGHGSFTNTHRSLGGWGQCSYGIGDVSGDGSIDIYVGIPHTPPPSMVHATNLIWLGDGQGNFTAREHNVPNAVTRAVGLADFNHDGTLDLFLADQGDWGNYSKVFFNNGSGTFTNSNQNLGNGVRDAEVLDFNNDGSPDLFLSRGPFGANGWPNTIWTNNGAGRFTDSGFRMGSASSVLAELGDLNSDGKPDVMAIHVQNPVTASAYTDVWLNNSHFRPFIRAHPTNQTGLPGGSVSFRVTATGDTPMAYQWRFNETHLPPATNSALVITNIQRVDIGSYLVIVTNALGAVTSNPSLLLADTDYLKLSTSAPGQLWFQCWQGASVQTESSTNLVDWQFLVTLTNLTGTLEFTDPEANHYPSRFYRAGFQP